MYYWNFGYTYSSGPDGNRIEQGEATYVAANFAAAMDQFNEHIKLHFSPTVNVCDIAIMRSGPVKAGVFQEIARAL